MWAGLVALFSGAPISGTGAALGDSESQPGDSAAILVSIVGYLHAIWNGHARYFLTTDKGESIELILEERLVRAAGGTSALDRQRVRIRGERLTSPRDGIRVRTIEFE